MDESQVEYGFDNYATDFDPSILYQTKEVADGVDTFRSVTSAEVAKYHEEGYLIVHNAFSPREVHESIEALLDLIEGKNPDFRKGIQFEKHAREILPTLPRERRSDVVRKLGRFVEYDERLSAMASHPGLLDVVEQLIGGRPDLWADKALLKPPSGGREKPWHQDLAYFNLPLWTPVITAWIALDRAVPGNGCMYLIPGSHREGPIVHFRRRDWQICDTDVQASRAVVAPLEPGGCLLFDGLLHHGTPPNNSSLRRRALQFTYYPKGTRTIPSGDRMEIFGSEGKDVEC